MGTGQKTQTGDQSRADQTRDQLKGPTNSFLPPWVFRGKKSTEGVGGGVDKDVQAFWKGFLKGKTNCNKGAWKKKKKSVKGQSGDNRPSW